MAEFCKECYIAVCGGIRNDRIKLSKDLDLCEGCGEYKRVIVSVRPTFKTFIMDCKEYFEYKKANKGDK